MDIQYILKNFGTVLRKIRLEKGLKQGDVAAGVGMHKSSYCLLEQGKRALNLYDMAKLSVFYDMTLSQMGERLQQSPAELNEIDKLRMELDTALKQNAWLKQELHNLKEGA